MLNGICLENLAYRHQKSPAVGLIKFYNCKFFLQLRYNVILRALAMDLPYAKCKVHLAFRPKKCLATERPNLGKAKFFWHSAIVPSYI